MLPPGAPKRAVFSETAKVTPVSSKASAWCLIHPPAPGLAGAIRLASLGNLSRLLSIRRPMATRTRVTSAGAVLAGYTIRRVVLCFVCLAFTFCIRTFSTLLLARPGYQPVWGLHTPYLCSGYRILTDATVGSFWIGVSLCAVYLRL